MIIKNFETNKINLDQHKFILLYGQNEGHKKEITQKILNQIEDKEILSYDEKFLSENLDNIYDNISTNSFFEKNRVILIKKASDKIISFIEELAEKNIDGISLILNSNSLDKKSKLRKLFEKTDKFVCIPFYADNIQILSKLTLDFLKEKKIPMSSYNINYIVNLCNGDREVLFNELTKIEYFAKTNKKITDETLIKLTNLIENYSISDLIDSCLVKNKKKIIKILNENNFNDADSIIITRTFLNKAKRILKLSIEYNKSKNIDLTMSNARPPIFWKDQEIIKQQILKWKPNKIKKLIYKINEIELMIKININNSVNLITDFLLEQSSTETSN